MYVIRATDLCVGIQLSCLSNEVIWKKEYFFDYDLCIVVCRLHHVT